MTLSTSDGWGPPVRQLDLDDDTVVFFTSDNGPHQEGGHDPHFFPSAEPLRGFKRDMYDGGIRVPMIVRAPGRVPADRTSDLVWAHWDVLPTVADLADYLGFTEPSSFVRSFKGWTGETPKSYRDKMQALGTH